MSGDDEILRAFVQRLDASKAAPATKETSREDLIEKAKENYGTFFDFVAKLDALVKEKLGGNATVMLDFGDFDSLNSILSAFIVIQPVETDRENLTIWLRFQGRRLRFEHMAFKQPSGSNTFEPDDIDQVKGMLAGVVSSWMTK